MKNIILSTDTPLVGGAEKHMHLLAKHLSKEKFKVSVVCSKYKRLDQWCETMKKDNINVIRMAVSHKHDPRHYTQLKKIIKDQQASILHIHLWNPGACRYAFWAAPKTVKIVTTEHDPFPLSGLKKTFKKKTLRKTKKTIAVSSANAEQMLLWYPELKGKITVIHNGIDLEAFERELIHFSQQENQKIRTHLLKASPDDEIMLTIAALHPRKGLVYLLEAFKKVHEAEPHTRLIIIGEGPQKKELEKKIKKLKLTESAAILDYQENIPKILKSADLFVLPSVKEAFGLVLLEAMAAQLPIIASNVGGIPEIVEHQKNGILVAPGDSEALAEKILLLLQNKPLAEKLAFLGHHRVKEFDIKKMVQKTEEVYDHLL